MKRLTLLIAALAATSVLALPAVAREKRHHRRPPTVARAAQPAPAPAEAKGEPTFGQPPLDDLYRRRGYGVGGAVFGGDTAMAGACADLRFAQPASCGRGYGIYGNGLGTQFGR